jgi:phosphoribosyl 1,2-cyclic phosphodiesterase
MQIKCWGARGSIPVSGPEYVRYGGDTPCLEIRPKHGNVIVVDSGTGILRLGQKLISGGEREIDWLFTHTHWDHILGFPFFEPLFWADSSINIYGCNRAMGDLSKLLKNTMRAPHFPITFSEIKAKLNFEERCLSPFKLGSLEVETIFLNHPNRGLGFKFREEDKTLVFLTDNELGYSHPGSLSYESYLDFCQGVDVLIHDAEYTEKEYENTCGWGHSTYTQALELALRAKVKTFALYHHNRNRSDRDIDSLVQDCHQRITAAGQDMQCMALAQGQVLESLTSI